MKRIFIGLAVVLLLLVASVYIFIPSNISVSETAYIHCTSNGISRFIIRPANLKNLPQLRPGFKDNRHNSSSFIYNNITYTVAGRLENSFEIDISSQDSVLKSSLFIIPLSGDSSAVEWRTGVSAGLNLFNRITAYRKTRLIKNNMADILKNLKPYLEKQENVYGLKMEIGSFEDSSLLAIKSIFPAWPATGEVYKFIGQLQKHITEAGARQTGFPIMNVTEIEKGKYQLMVAVPTNKAIENQGAFFFRRMVNGNFLKTEVRGGNHTVVNAIQTLELYISDYKKMVMAIPFAALVTNRVNEPDTSKWITKIYYPVDH